VSSGFKISPDEAVHERVGAVVACQRRDSMFTIIIEKVWMHLREVWNRDAATARKAD
jgi:hypothetical protein